MEEKGPEIPQLKVKETPANCPVPPPCPVCPPKPKPTQVLLKVLLVLGMALVLALIILVGSGLRITKKESLLDIWLASRKGISPTPEVLATPTPDSTADWKTYTNQKYNYSFKYPAEAKLEEGRGHEERLQETILTFFGPNYQGPGEFTDGYGITFAVIKNPDNAAPDQLAQKLFTQSQKDIADKILEGDISKCKVEEVTRGGTTGARFTHCIKAPGSGILNFSEWFVKNGITYQIYAVLQNPNYQADFNQILSTFKFLDQTSSTEGWKTYTEYVDAFGYNLSFKYPEDWTVKKVAFSNNGGGGGHPNFATIFSPDQKSCVKVTITSESATSSLDDVLKSGATNGDASLADNIVISSRLLNVNGMATKAREVQRDGKSFKDGVISLVNDKRYSTNRVFTYLSSCSMIESGIYDQILSTFKFLE
jgi:hypothetical protein